MKIVKENFDQTDFIHMYLWEDDEFLKSIFTEAHAKPSWNCPGAHKNTQTRILLLATNKINKITQLILYWTLIIIFIIIILIDLLLVPVHTYSQIKLQVLVIPHILQNN